VLRATIPTEHQLLNVLRQRVTDDRDDYVAAFICILDHLVTARVLLKARDKEGCPVYVVDIVAEASKDLYLPLAAVAAIA
jgi:hypothetical protein